MDKLPWRDHAVLGRVLAQRRKLQSTRSVSCQKTWTRQQLWTRQQQLTQIRFWNSTPRICRGLNSVGTGLPSGCGSNAVPAGGYWRGTKYGTFGAGALYEARAAMCVVCRVSCADDRYLGVGMGVNADGNVDASVSTENVRRPSACLHAHDLLYALAARREPEIPAYVTNTGHVATRTRADQAQAR